MMTEDTLLICQTEANAPDDDSSVIISQEISQININEANKLYAQLIGLDVDHGFDLPVYSLVANQVWSADQYHTDSPGSLELLIPLYRRLNSFVDDETERIQCVGVSGLYLDVIKDLASNEGLQLEHNAVDSSLSWYVSVVRCTLWLLFSVIDVFVSVISGYFFNASDADVLVKYPTFRPDTFRPVEERLEISFDATFTLLTISFFRHARSVTEQDTNAVPLRAYDTLSGMAGDYPAVVYVIWDIIRSDTVVSATTDAIESETQIQLEAVTETLISRVVIKNPSALLYYGTADRLFSSDQYSCVVVTSLGPSGRLLTLPANKYGVRTLSLSHSITLQPVVANRQQVDAAFVEGEIASRLTNDELAKKFIPTGLPKHMYIYEKASGTPSSEQQRTLLIGTQPHHNRYRSILVTDVVPSVIEATNWRVILKLHPAESEEFYKELLNSIGYPPSDLSQVSIISENLYEHILQSDLLLTVTSNVGIEAVILGTPVVCYNPWVPDKRDPPYVSHGPVPKISASSDLIDIIEQYDLEKLQDRQQPLINGPYAVVGNSLDEIAAKVEKELSK